MPYMYILRCANGAYFTGSTAKDLEARLWEHNEGLGANFTRTHRPTELAYFEWTERVEDAYIREKQVQGWSRVKKEALINGHADLLPGLSRSTGTDVPVGASPSTGSGNDEALSWRISALA